MQEILLKIRYFERELSKSLEVTFYFLSNAIPYNGYDYKQQKGPGPSDQ